MRRLFWLYVLCSTFLLSSCCNLSNTSRPEAQYELSTVVQAVQFAIDSVAENDAWNASKEEKKHWEDACKLSKQKEDLAKLKMLNDAKEECKNVCSNGSCSFVEEKYCQIFTEPSSVDSFCGTRETGWCNSARSYMKLSAASKAFCEAHKTVTLPKLKKATLSLKVEEKFKSGGEASIMVVTFGGSKTKSSANTITLELSPRVRDTKYFDLSDENSDQEQIDLLEQFQEKREPLVQSDRSRKLSGSLESLILDAVRSSTLETVDENGKTIIPPMSLSNFKVEIALSIDSEGKFQIGKEWDSVPAELSLGSELSSKLSNTLVIEYSR